MTRPPDRCLEEILGQPAAFERAAEAMAAQVDRLRRLAERVADGPVLLAGMGSSHDACLAAAAVLGGAGIVAMPLEAAELLHVRRPMLPRAGLVVLVSQSGESPETVGLARAIGALDAPRPPSLAITNGPANPLAAIADLALDTAAGPETCPSTMTFAGSLVALAAVAGVIALRPPGPGPGPETPRDLGGAVATIVADVRVQAGSAATACAALLGDPDGVAARLGEWLGDRQTIVALGRGCGLAAAEMTSLTLMEAAGVPALALPTAEFRHGPLEIVGRDVAVVLFALEPATESLDRAFAAELAGSGAAVLLVGPAEPPPPGVEAIAVGGRRGILAPAVALGPLQLLARRLAHARGRRPDEFARGAKVTTRE